MPRAHQHQPDQMGFDFQPGFTMPEAKAAPKDGKPQPKQEELGPSPFSGQEIDGDEANENDAYADLGGGIPNRKF